MTCNRLFCSLIVWAALATGGPAAEPLLEVEWFGLQNAGEGVMLLHGMARTKRAMRSMGRALAAKGYRVCNVGYPSTKKMMDPLVQEHLGPAVALCRQAGFRRINVVTHSLGGIMLRAYLAEHAMPDLGRVVMLSPPNRGSEVVDVLGDWAAFDWLNGPVGDQLGTGEGSVPLSLGPAVFELGILTGDRSINWILSLYIPGPDDGKVSPDHAKLEGMKDFRVIHATHPMIMRNNEAIELTVRFLKTGTFDDQAHTDHKTGLSGKD